MAWFPHRGSYRIACNHPYILLSDECEHSDNCVRWGEGRVEERKNQSEKEEVILSNHVYASGGKTGTGTLLAPEEMSSS